MADSARLDELRRQFEENPRRYFAPLASALRRAGDAGAAVTLARAQLATYPGHLTGHVILGQALLDVGDVAAARGAFERAAALDSGNVVALQQLVAIARTTSDEPGAAHWMARLVEADPELAAEVAPPPPAAAFEPLDFEDFAADDAGAFTAAALDPRLAVEERRDEPAEEPQAAALADVEGESLAVAGLDEPDDAHAPLDPVVGLDVPPADPLPAAMRDALPELLDVAEVDAALPPIAEKAAAGERHDAEADGVVPPPAAPFVTETMAGLLLAQGHVAQALDVYERLLAQRPDDAQLRARVAELRGAGAPAAEPAGSANDSPTAREFFAALAHREAPEDEPAAAEPARPAPDVTDDERAARMWRAAFAPVLPPEADQREADQPEADHTGPKHVAAPDVASTDAADTAAVVAAPTAAFDDLSFDHFFAGFGDPAPADEPPAGDFERWAAAADRSAAAGDDAAALHPVASAVSAAEPAHAAVPAASAIPSVEPPASVLPAAPPPPDDPDDDLAQFNAWLRGLAE